jgi:hypothetical protein
MHYVDNFSLDLIINQVVFEAFDGILADLGEFGMGKADQFADAW